MPTLRLEIVTPEAKTFSEDVDMVTIPGVDGELGVLPLHAPLMTQIKPGTLKILQGGKETLMAVGDGFAEVTQDHVSILSDMAAAETEIDEAAVHDAMERAKAELAGTQAGSDEQFAAQAAIANSLAKLHLKRHRR